MKFSNFERGNLNDLFTFLHCIPPLVGKWHTGVSIRKACSEKLKIFKNRKENFGNRKNVFPTRKCKNSFNFERVWSFAIFSKNVKLRSQPLKTLLSAHKTQHTLCQISNNCYPQAQKAIRNLLSNRIKRGTTCENIHKGAKWEREIETGDVPL